MTILKHHLATALHSFRRHKFVSIIQLIGLTVGFACFLVGFGAVHYWSMSDRQYPGSGRTYVVTQDTIYKGTAPRGPAPSAAYHLAKYLRIDVPELAAVARATNWAALPVAAGGRTMSLKLAGADPDFLKIFRQRVQQLSVDALRAPHSVVLTSDASMRLFGSTGVQGRSVRLNDQIDLNVTGIFDPPQPSHLGSDGYIRFDLLVSWDVIETLVRATEPAIADPGREIWFASCCTTYVQLPQDGLLTLDGLKQRLGDIAQRRVPESQRAFASIVFGAVPVNAVQTTQLERLLFANSGVHISFKAALLILATVVLAIASMNYANLAAAQVLDQSGQIGVRRVLGARKFALGGQSLLESALSCAAALVIAMVLVATAATPINRYLAADFSAVATDAAFWLIVAATYLIVVAVAGAYPAMTALSVRPSAALRSVRGRGAATWMSKSLVAAQFVTASVLISVVLVINKQSAELEKLGLESTTSHVVAITNNLVSSAVGFDTFKAQLLRFTQIEAVSATDSLPWQFGGNRSPLSRSPEPGSRIVNTTGGGVWYDFFATMGMHIIAGRAFSPSRDDVSVEMNADPARPNATVVDRALTEQLGFASPQAAVDQLIYVSNPFASTPQALRIIGVIENQPVQLVSNGTTATSYHLYPSAARFALIRIRGNDVAGALAAIDRTWKRIAPQVQIRRQFTDELFQKNYEIFQRINRTFTALTALALAVACLGLLGMAMHVLRGRTHEVGVRKTLGASAARILAMLLADFSRPVILANLIALPLAVLVARLYLSAFIHRTAITAAPFLLSLLVTLLFAWAAIVVQATRAARVKPAAVLRYE